MNERIEKLVSQSFTDEQGERFDIEKFAELIVRECANELIKWKNQPFPYDEEFGARLIKQHFGIEE
jgi:hypothetical protein